MHLVRTELERAFELARSGTYSDVISVVRRLKSEGYSGSHVDNKQVLMGLADTIEVAKRPV